MILNFKRLMKPLIIAGTGLLSLLFMFFTYISPSLLEDYSAYACMGLGSSSPAAIVTSLGFDAAGVMYIVAIMMIIMFITSLVLLLSGVAMIVREVYGVNLIIKVNPRLVDRITQYSLLAHSAATIFGMLMVVIFCVANAPGKLSIIIGASLPGVSTFFLFLLSVGASVSLFVLERKLFSKPYLLRKVHTCTQCGAYYAAPFQCCSVCGGALAPQQLAVPNEFTANPPVVRDFNYALIPLFLKNTWGKVLAFFERKNISRKKVYIGCAALGGILLISIVLLCIFAGPSPKYIVPEDTCLITGVDDGKLIILTDGKMETVDMESNPYNQQYSLDGSVIAWTTADEVLYIYKNGKLTEVAQNVDNYLLSAEGTGIAYVDDEETLFLHSIKKNSSKEISKDVPENAFCLSPDGQSVAYVKFGDEKTGLYVSVNGKDSQHVGNSLYPFAISDKGEFLYYKNEESNALYIMEDLKDTMKLTKGDSYYFGVYLYFNADHTQLLFEDDSNLYVVDNGKEKVKISSSGLDQFGDFEEYGIVQTARGSCQTLPIEEFGDQYFLNDSETLFYLDSRFETHKVATYVSYFHTSESGDVLYYVAGYSSTLYRGEGNGKTMKAKQIASGAYAFKITTDGEHCYYRNSAGDLMYVKGNGAAKRIAEDVNGFVLSHDGYAFFMCDYSSRTGGTLYESHNGSSKTRIAENVDSEVLTTVNGTYYAQIDGDSEILYGAAKKAKFSKLYTAENP